MKNGLILLLIILTNYKCFGQELTPDTSINSQYTTPENLPKETRKIMGYFHFMIRKNISKDGTLTFKIDTSLKRHITNAVFHFDGDKTIGKNNDDPDRYYLAPMIILSERTDNILMKRVEVPKNKLIQTYVSIVHELTHYFQTVGKGNYFYPPPKPTIDDLKKYSSQEIEFEALVVSNYYGLQNLYPADLNKILKMNIPMKRKGELIIDTWQQKMMPKWIPLFSNK